MVRSLWVFAIATLFITCEGMLMKPLQSACKPHLIKLFQWLIRNSLPMHFIKHLQINEALLHTTSSPRIMKLMYTWQSHRCIITLQICALHETSQTYCKYFINFLHSTEVLSFWSWYYYQYILAQEMS